MSSGNKMPSGEGYFWTVALFGAIIIVVVNIGGCVWGGI
jgi:hypothetical protein